MSIEGSLTQISPYLLEKAKVVPSLLDVFSRVTPFNSEDEPKLENLQELSLENIVLLHEITSPEQVVNQWTLQDLVRIKHWKDYYPEDYRSLTADIHQIVMEGKTTSRLELLHDWHLINYIFCNDASMDILPFLTDGAGELFRVNPVLCGQVLDEDDEYETVRYLEVAEVQEIANALPQISDEIILQRFEQGVNYRSKLYSYWEQDDYDELLELCNSVKNFYYSASHQENAVLIEIIA